MAGPRTKMIAGALLIMLGVWWYIPGGLFNWLLAPESGMTNLESLVALVQGMLGAVVVVTGILIVWIEHDEIKMRRELQSQELGKKLHDSVQAMAEGGRSPADDPVSEPGGEPMDELDNDEDGDEDGDR